jgi:hypothetical protein
MGRLCVSFFHEQEVKNPNFLPRFSPVIYPG